MPLGESWSCSGLPRKDGRLRGGYHLRKEFSGPQTVTTFRRRADRLPCQCPKIQHLSPQLLTPGSEAEDSDVEFQGTHTVVDLLSSGRRSPFGDLKILFSGGTPPTSRPSFRGAWSETGSRLVALIYLAGASKMLYPSELEKQHTLRRIKNPLLASD